MEPDPHFNSTMVRLIARKQSVIGMVISFQFHDGTIDRGERNFCNGRLLYFNSTMVRLIEIVRLFWSPVVLHFNSTMVRLIARTKPDKKVAVGHFNSTMVRLIGICK